VTLLLRALCLTRPVAGYFASETLVTQCFGLDRPVPSASSCTAIHTVEDKRVLYTHDGRGIPELAKEDQVRAEPLAIAIN
jgi:hypothetical protein